MFTRFKKGRFSEGFLTRPKNKPSWIPRVSNFGSIFSGITEVKREGFWQGVICPLLACTRSRLKGSPPSLLYPYLPLTSALDCSQIALRLLGAHR
jgi:hypothetical protein